MSDPWGSPIDAAMSHLGMGGPASRDATYGYGIRGTSGRDATMGMGIRGLTPGVDPLMDQALPAWDAYMQQKYPDQSSQGYNTGNYNGALGSAVSSAGGQWATLDSLNSAFAAAQTQLGVPANLLKGIIAREGSFGNDFYTVPRRGESILAFNGIFQSTAASHGIDWNRMISDKSYAVWATGKVMSDIYKSQNGQYGWEGAAATYLTGSPTGASDPEGTTQTQDYLYGPNGVITHWKYLDGFGGSNPSMDPASGMWGGGSSTTNALGAMFGPGASVPAWGEFNVPSSNGLYDYGRQYGLNGTNHTGVDVPLNFGSPIKSPTGGTVLCAGTGNGQDSQGGSCAAFNNTIGPSGYGAGRLEVRLDNGAVLIFGHASSSAVRPGQRVSPGSLIGYSGGMNSPHVHLEARVQDQSGNWRIVDPRSVLGGGSYPTSAGWGPSAQSGPGSWGNSMDSGQIMIALLGGQHPPGY